MTTVTFATAGISPNSPRTTPGAIEAALRAIISEVTPGYRPFFSSGARQGSCRLIYAANG